MSTQPDVTQVVAQLQNNLKQASGQFQQDGAAIKAKLESTLASASKQFDAEKLKGMTDKLVTKDLLNATTKMGAELNEVVGGFQALTKVADDIAPKLLDISKPLQNTMKQFPQRLAGQNFAEVAEELKNFAGKVPIAQMTADVKGIGDKLVREIESEDVKGKLQAITGKASLAAKELLDVVVASPLPEAMSSALGEVSKGLNFEIKVDEMQDILKEGIDLNVPLGQLTTAAEKAIGGVDDALGELNNSVSDTLKSIAGTALKIDVNIPELGNLDKIASEFRSVAQGELGKVQQALGGGFNSLMGNAIESAFSPAANILRDLGSIGGVKIDIPKPIVDQIVRLKEADNLDEAIKVMKRFSDLDENVIKDALLNINASASAFAASATPGVDILISSMKKFASAFDENPTKWGSDIKFPVVETREAVSADLQSVKSREITSLIVVSTQTGNNKPLNATEFAKLFYERYKAGPPFNYLIHRSGKVEKGRPLDSKFPSELSKQYLQEGQLKWYNSSVVVFMVGGYNAPEGTPDIEKYAGESGYTADQFKALNKFIAGMLNTYPGINVYGASDINAGAGPYFDVQTMVKSKHNKTNITLQTSTDDEPPTTTDIATATGPF
jgi:hypothetical protein